MSKATSLEQFLANPRKFTQIDFNSQKIGDDGAIALASALQNHNGLTHLWLENNQIGAEGAIALANALQNHNGLTHLRLYNNQIGAEGAIALANALQNHNGLTHLWLYNNQIGAEGAIALANALQNHNGLTQLGLSNNQIGAEGAIALADALQNHNGLTQLGLSNNQIGEDGAIALADVLQNHNGLTQLGLSNNQIGAEGAIALANALQNHNGLTQLRLSNNQIGADGINVLKNSFAKLGNNLKISDQRPVIQKQNVEQMEIISVEEINNNKEETMKGTQNSTTVERQFNEEDQKAVKEIIKLIKEGNDRLQSHHEQGILILGKTGSGKTTLAHVLSGSKMEAIEDDQTGELLVDAKDHLGNILIGHSMASETRIPNKRVSPNHDVVIWDCPGFKDTNTAQEIANAFYIKRMFETNTMLKFLLVVPESNIIDNKGSAFIETVEQFMSGFNDVAMLAGSVSLIITKAAPNRKVVHIENFINKIFEDNQGATNEIKEFVRALFDSTTQRSAIHLFHKPSSEGEMPEIDLLTAINNNSNYIEANPAMVNMVVSENAQLYANNLLQTVSNNFNSILTTISKAITDANIHMTDDNLNVCNQDYDLIAQWMPDNRNHQQLVQHNWDEYFIRLDQLKVLKECMQYYADVQTYEEGIVLIQDMLKIFAEYTTVNEHHLLSEKMQHYSYVLAQQFEYMKFFGEVSDQQLPDIRDFTVVLTRCKRSLLEQYTNAIINLELDTNKPDPKYYTKAIGYLSEYAGEYNCKQNLAIANIKLGDICYDNENKEDALHYYKVSVLYMMEVNNHNTHVYDRMGSIFHSEGEYEKAIKCYQVVNNAFRVNKCFKDWLNKDSENPYIMKLRAEHLENIGAYNSSIKYYGYASSLSSDEKVKTENLAKIGNILIGLAGQGQVFINNAENSHIYNFAMAGELLDLIGDQV